MLGETICLLQEAGKLKGNFNDDIQSDILLSNVKDLATKLNEHSSELLDSCNVAIAESEQKKPPCSSSHDQNALICRDPADRRRLVLTENQKIFLADKGPFQPHLKSFPINPKIKQKKGNQLRFTSNWYAEYPDL